MESSGQFHLTIHRINPIRAGRGGWISPHFFQMAISQWKRGFGGPKFRDFSSFIMNFQKINFFFVFHSVFGWSRRCRLIKPPPALKQHPEGLTFVNNQFILESTRAEETQFSSQKIRYINNFSLLLLQDLGASSQHWFTLLKSVQHLFTNKPVHAWGIV